MDMRRMLLIGLAMPLGHGLAGCLLGAGVGLVAPDLYRSLFRVSGSDPFDPVAVGLGVGCVAGFLAGSALGLVGLVLAIGPGLLAWRPFARGALQPTLGGLVLVIGLVALGFASLRNPSTLGSEAWFGLTTLALTSATLVAARGRPGGRGFATGFAVFGWSYFVLSLMPESRAQLPTTRLLAVLEKQVSGGWTIGTQHLSLEMGSFPARVRGAYWEPVVTSPSGAGIPGRLEIDEVQPDFRRIGHALLTLMAGVVGGLACEIRRKNRARPAGEIPVA